MKNKKNVVPFVPKTNVVFDKKKSKDLLEAKPITAESISLELYSNLGDETYDFLKQLLSSDFNVATAGIAKGSNFDLGIAIVTGVMYGMNLAAKSLKQKKEGGDQ